MDSSGEMNLKTDFDDHSGLKSEHDPNRDDTKDNEKSSDQEPDKSIEGPDKGIDPYQGLGAKWTLALFPGSSTKIASALNRTVERTVDESNVSRFLPSSLKNRLLPRDEPLTPIGHAIKRAALTTARRSVNSMKKLRDSFSKPDEETRSGTTREGTESPKADYFREQRIRSSVAGMVQDITYLVQSAFAEVGATEEMFDDNFKVALITAIIETDHNFTSWDELHFRMNNMKAQETLRAIMWNCVNAHFPLHSRPFSPVRTLLVESLFHGACIIAEAMTMTAPPLHTMSPSFLPDVSDMRLFEYKPFQVLWQRVLRTSDYSITDVDIGNLTGGTRVHGYMCVFIQTQYLQF
jgi:hypothetical protein